MNLETIYVCMDETEKEQKHLELVFLFSEGGKCAEYTLLFDSGMHLDDFRSFLSFCSKKINKEDPTICKEE